MGKFGVLNYLIMTEGEKLIPINIVNEMESSYIDYSMSVIVSRALPDVRDGLKPVHRRVLYGMHEMGIRASSSYRKSARIVGEVLENIILMEILQYMTLWSEWLKSGV